MSAPHDRISELLHSIQSCICDGKAWATATMLKLNDNKTKLMLDTSNRTKHIHNLPTSITIGNAQFPFKQSVKNLGLTLDCHLTMNAHVTNIARTCYFELRRFASIRKFLSSTATATLYVLCLHGLVQVINKPTHRCGHIIDWVIVRPDDDIHRKSTVTDSLQSDHYCTKSYFNISVSKPSTLYRTVRNIANIDRPSFIAELSSVSEFSSVENANQFCNFLRTVLDKHAPPSMRKVVTHSSSPWFESIRDELFIAKR